jgi:RNA polymerase sigma-70 factor (ECF subfamily)
MLGSFADAEDLVQTVLLKAWRARSTYAGDAPLLHWLMRIATNACLSELARRGARGLPQLDRDPAQVGAPIEELEAATWVTPAPDAQLFPNPDRALEAREDVAIAFIALLQRLPPKQRAVLLLKDVVGWPAQDIAEALDLTVASVNSSLHRARETVAARPRAPAPEPAPEVLRDYIRCWEGHDLEGLVARLRKDIVFAMPPHATWYRGIDAVGRFLQTPRFSAFWSKGLRATQTRANGLPALVWYTPRDGDDYRPHSIHVMRFEDGELAEATNFIGAHYLRGFDFPERLPR